MNVHTLFPLKVYLNLKERDDRKTRMEERLAAVGLSAERLEAFPSSKVGDEFRGFLNARKRACAISKRLAIRVAMHKRSEALLIFEDDIVFHPEFISRVARLELPEDWGMFYFGCQHRQPPKPVGPGIVRVTRALDNHAFAIRSEYYAPIRRAIKGVCGKTRLRFSSDQLLSDLQEQIPTYAAFPNLIWQDYDWSDVALRRYTNYSRDGSQRLWTEYSHATQTPATYAHELQ